ncbi:hypothetical protein [Arenicella xantha]|uniref:Gpi18-like mannosyltransferase n=1 Tax=Arenicella xantha TaxID=644221 RepID=A0A395JF51_9GAMM|nr:hypothetical protein [Arenicella xantha]RBP48355.1 hypothetical protein DFR28_10884 [Arenicella xantha]
MTRPLNNRQFFILALGVAVLLRLLLMPFFAHVDLFSEYRRVYYVLEQGLYFDNAHRSVIFFIELFFAWLSQAFITIDQAIFSLPDPTRSVASLSDYSFFLNDPHIFRYLLLFKLPYLIFDIATAAVIWRFIDDPIHKRIALLIWLFNPVTLFATYIFGRFEVISLFFLAASALQLKQHRLLAATILFAISLHCREINLLFAPFFLLALIDFKDPALRNALVVSIAASIIGLLFLCPSWLFPKLGGDLSLFVDTTADHGNDAFNKLLSLGYYWFYPVIIGLASLAIYAWESGHRSHAERYVSCCAVALFIYFGFNVHSIHYAAWLTIFPILSIQYGKKVVLPFIVFSAAWVVLWLLKTDNGVFTLFLAAPLSSDFIGRGFFPAWYNLHIAPTGVDLHQAIQIMRALFFVVMGFFTYRVLRANHKLEQ